MTRASFVVLAACASSASEPVHPAAPSPIAFTYLGVAGWQIEGANKLVLTDPYLSRPANPDAPLVPDVVAIAAHAPARGDLVVVDHPHYDHLLDAPTVTLRTGARL